MNEILTINDYSVGWSWLKSGPLEDFTWLIEVFSTMTNNMDTYNYCQYHNQKLLQVNQIPITTQTQVQPSTSTYVPQNKLKQKRK